MVTNSQGRFFFPLPAGDKLRQASFCYTFYVMGLLPVLILEAAPFGAHIFGDLLVNCALWAGSRLCLCPVFFFFF